MKLLFVLFATLAVVAATSEPRFCKTKSRGRNVAKECIFPFVYKGVTYDSCTTVDTINDEAWCATVPTVRFTTAGKVMRGDVGDCDFTTSCLVDPGSGSYCEATQDCYSFGNTCDPAPPGSSGCVCKNNICKLSSGCGTAGLNWFNKCSECSSEDCEDEGVCSFVHGICTGPEDYPDSSPTPDGGVSTGTCDTAQDCYSFGNACDPPPPGSSGCVCKNNVCKLSSGCGTAGLNWFNKCSECSAEDCEDEGVCSFRRGRCTGPEDYPDVPDIGATNARVGASDNYCTYDVDCQASGKLCNPQTGVQDAGCICKKGECKISSGCGTHGAFSFRSCSECDSNLDGCEDEGACKISGSRSGKKCVSK